MKKFYLPLRKVFFAFSFLVLSVQGNAQFTTAGDIAFTGYVSSAASGIESFSFVILKNIPAGSTLNFTDRGWNGTAFNAGTESLLTWTSGTALVAGREVTISGAASSATMTVVISGSNINAGTASGTMPSFPTSGDQILAYVGTVASPTFIAGMHMNSYNNGNGGTECGSTSAAGWDPPACANPGNPNSSALPTGLTGGTTAVYIGIDNTFNSDFNNAKFNCTGPMATPAQVRSSVNNYSAGVNWIATDDATLTTLPSGCAFLASIFPLDIISFTGSNQANYIGLNWKTANEADDRGHYELEKSADGRNFSPITNINMQGFSYLYNNYSFNDNNPLQGANFYRLKMVSPAGQIKYSQVVKVLFGMDGKPAFITPNPASTDITVSFKGTQFNLVTISDLSGRIVLREKLLTNNQKLDVSQLPAGNYAITLFGAGNRLTEKLIIAH